VDRVAPNREKTEGASVKSDSVGGLIFDRPEEGLFGVCRSVFSDPAVFELEMRRIFEGTWVYLAHESQVPEPGDFMVIRIGQRSVIVVRAGNGRINAFFNACAHRGAALCATERGSVRSFVCSYHSWAYDLDGRNIHIKDRESGGYSKQFAEHPPDLTPVARIDSYRGFIFASLNPDVAGLQEHLGAASGFIDLLVDQSPQGLEILKGSSTYRVRANWKMHMENGIDNYHFEVVHQNYVKVLQHRARHAAENPDQRTLLAGFVREEWMDNTGWYDLGNGHALTCFPAASPESRPSWDRREELNARLGKERADWLLHRQRNLLVFPNVYLMDQASTQIRVIRPVSPGISEVKSYCFAPRGESARAREIRIRQFEDFFNASGMATPDDLAVFEAVQIGCEANGELRQRFGRGLGRANAGGDERSRSLGIKPAYSGDRAPDETIFRGVYRHWARLMSTPEK